MPNPRIRDVSTTVCADSDHRFGGACPAYDARVAQRCRMLQSGQLQAFWTTCRLLYETLARCNRAFVQLYPGLPIDEAEDLDLSRIVQRIAQQDVTFESPAAWYAYLKKTMYLELRGQLVKRGLLPEKKRCGTCQYLLKAERPYLCQKHNQPRQKTAAVCADYCPEIPQFETFEEWHVPARTEPAPQNDNIFESIRACFRRRIAQETIGSKARQRFERQRDVFLVVWQYLADGYSKEEALRHLTAQWQVHAKTIRRDLDDIQEFLAQECL